MLVAYSVARRFDCRRHRAPLFRVTVINGFEDALHVGGLDAFKIAAVPRCVKKPD